VADDYSDLVAAASGAGSSSAPRRPRAPVEKPISPEEAQKISETVKPVEGIYDAVTQQPEMFAKGVSPDALDAVNKRWGEVVKHGSAGEIGKAMEMLGGGSSGFSDVDDPQTRVEADNAWDILKPMMLDKENKLNSIFHPTDVLFSSEEDDGVKAGHRERLARKLEQVAQQVQRDKLASGSLLDTVKKLRASNPQPVAAPVAAGGQTSPAPAAVPAAPQKPGLFTRLYNNVVDPAVRFADKTVPVAGDFMPQIKAGLNTAMHVLPQGAQDALGVNPEPYAQVRDEERGLDASAEKKHPVASYVGGGALSAATMAGPYAAGMEYLTSVAGLTPSAAAAFMGGAQAATTNPAGKTPGQILTNTAEGMMLGPAGEAVGDKLLDVAGRNPVIKRMTANLREPTKTSETERLFDTARETPELRAAMFSGGPSPEKLAALKPYIREQATTLSNQLDEAAIPGARKAVHEYLISRSPEDEAKLAYLLGQHPEGDALMQTVRKQAQLSDIEDNFMSHEHGGVSPNSASGMLHPHMAVPNMTNPGQVLKTMVQHPRLALQYTLPFGSAAVIKNNADRLLQNAAGAARRGDPQGWVMLEQALKNGTPFASVADAMGWKAGPTKTAKKVRKAEAQVVGN
jgi:hypothetical protein